MPHSTPRADVGPHYAQLDGLRGLAALAVVLSHSTALFNRLDFGPAGVRLFFVLSGFLITGILLRARDEAQAAGQGLGGVLAAFYARRSVRIFPVYYAVVLLASWLALPGTAETFWANVTYTNNFLIAWNGEHIPGATNHLWTLSVEEQFYLFWPLLVLGLPARALVPTLLAMIALGPITRGVAAMFEPGDDVMSKVLTCCCLDSLGLGALLAVAWRIPGTSAERGRSRALLAALALGTVLLAVTFGMAWMGQGVVARRVLKVLAFSLISVWLVATAARGFPGIVGRVLASRPLVYLGTISYGVYLLHMFIPPLLVIAAESVGLSFHWKALSSPVRFLVMFGTTLPLAMLSWHLFEKPLNDLKRWFPYVRKEPTPPRAVEVAAA